MQRVSALLPSWDRSKRYNTAPVRTTAPGALNRVFGAWGSLNHINTVPSPTRYGREAYWPASLDKECDKAARILKSFCTDGFLALDEPSPPSSPTSPASLRESPAPPTPSSPRSSAAYVNRKIPPRVIQNAVGLAIFSCMRSGLWMSGSGGAGLITARKADGTWSPPSGIILHTSALGFVIGVDIYDCVLVINSVQTLELFTRPRLTLGTEVNLAVGPLIDVASDDRDIRRKHLDDTVLTYVKARGRHQPVPLGGSVVVERSNENDRFYDVRSVTVLDVLGGNIPKTIPEIRPLFEVIKAAEGRTDFDKAIMQHLATQPAPGDALIETPKDSPIASPKTPFGVPNLEDPDPFGVIGLEMAGIEIREAGTRLRPTSTQFEFNPSPTSPLFGKFNRQSLDTFLAKSNRGSYMSYRTQATAMTDAGTQTDVGSTLDTTISAATSVDGVEGVLSEKLPPVYEPEEVDYTKIDTSVIAHFSSPSPEDPPSSGQDSVPPIPIFSRQRHRVVDQGVGTSDGVFEDKASGPEPVPVLTAAAAKAVASQPAAAKTPEPTDKAAQADEPAEDADDEDDEDDEEEEPIVYEVATTAASSRAAIMSSQVTQVIHAKGALVTIPKRVPPPLPPRSPARTSRGSRSEFGDVSSLRSPLRSSFNMADVSLEAHARRSTESGKMAFSLEEAPERHSMSSLRSTTTADEAVDGQRWSTGSTSPQLSPAARPVEMASSVESDAEPKTPRIDNGFAEEAAEKASKGAGELQEVHIVANQPSHVAVA